MPTPGNLIDILLVEDNPDDIELTLEALQETKLANRIAVVRDGVEAMQYLRQEGSYKDAQLPALILLDLNMPRKDGREVLMEIKGDAALSHIPVAVLTTSDADEDILKAYKAHANCYIRKPVRLADMIAVAKMIDDFWFGLVTLPPQKL